MVGKGEKNIFTVGESGKHDFSQVIRADINTAVTLIMVAFVQCNEMAKKQQKQTNKQKLCVDNMGTF